MFGKMMVRSSLDDMNDFDMRKLHFHHGTSVITIAFARAISDASNPLPPPAVSRSVSMSQTPMTNQPSLGRQARSADSLAKTPICALLVDAWKSFDVFHLLAVFISRPPRFIEVVPWIVATLQLGPSDFLQGGSIAPSTLRSRSNCLASASVPVLLRRVVRVLGLGVGN